MVGNVIHWQSAWPAHTEAQLPLLIPQKGGWGKEKKNINVCLFLKILFAAGRGGAHL